MIDEVKFRGNQHQEQFHMLGFLWELVPDLYHAPGFNISQNLGFETALAIC
jgi:hypothetical protein